MVTRAPPRRITTRAPPGHSLRFPEPLAQQGIRDRGDSVSRLRHRPERDDLQRHRRRAAQAVPVPDPDRILVVGEQNQRTDSQAGLSYLDMRDWKEANSVFTTIAGVAGRSLTIADRGGEPERYLGAAVSWDLFPLLGTSPILGRGFTVEDDRPGAGPVVLLGYDLVDPALPRGSAHRRRIHPDQRQASRRDWRDAGRVCLSQ